METYRKKELKYIEAKLNKFIKTYGEIFIKENQDKIKESVKIIKEVIEDTA